MDDACRREVEELHRFFQEWFAGRMEKTEESFRRFTEVMAEGFEIVSPGGTVTARVALVEALRAAHAANRDDDPPLRIWIENHRGRSLGEGVHLVTYEEWHEEEGVSRGRISTAAFREKPGTPNGVEWVQVHETWMA